MADGHVVGAVGVSGASSADEDQDLAVLGADAFAGALGAAPAVTHITARDMEAAFAVGRLVVDTDGYKVDAGRRTRPGEVELHDRVTDLMYVLHGEATVMTGDAPTETTTRLAAGDVFVVPAGVPHTFVRVTDPFRYLVVKVSS